MPDMKTAAQAYMASSSHRNPREQEADIFQCATGGLRAAQSASPIMRIRAIADNRRMWMMVMDLVRDPRNVLPEDLRAAIISLSLSVQREMDRDEPDFDFLIDVNENMAAGLAGQV